jgi:hypothetical protein
MHGGLFRLLRASESGKPDRHERNNRFPPTRLPIWCFSAHCPTPGAVRRDNTVTFGGTTGLGTINGQHFVPELARLG